MKVKYVGETFYNGLGLTNDKVYECIDIDEDAELLEVIDDEEENVLYPIDNPKPVDGSSKGGKWEIIEDENGRLTEIFKKLNLI